MEIRNHQPGDLGWIISVHGEIYSHEFDFDGSFETNIADKVVQYFSHADDFNRVWIALVDDKRAGSVALRKLSDGVGFINFVVVLDEFRGSGIANGLMETVLDHAKAHGITKLRLETFTCLASARELYKKLGFEIVESNRIFAFGKDLEQEFWELSL